MALPQSSIAILSLLLLLVLHAGPATASRPCKAAQVCLDAVKQGKKCPLIPVPRSAIARPVPPGTFRLTRLRPGVWSYFDGTYRTLILYTRGRVVAVDFPSSTELLAKATLKILKGKKPYRVDMVYSHRHFDHIGGASKYYHFIKKKFPQARIVVWATEESRKFILRDSPPPLPLPHVIVGRRGRVIWVSPALKLKLFITGGHTAHDLASYIPPWRGKPGIVHLVDILTPGFVPFLDFALSVDLGQYVKAHKKILRLRFKVFSGGHGRLGNRRDVKMNMRYTLDAVESARRAVGKVTPAQIESAGIPRVADPNAVEYGNAGFAFLAQANLQVNFCFKDLVAKYGCKLGSVDVFARSHCLTAGFFNFIDNPALV